MKLKNVPIFSVCVLLSYDNKYTKHLFIRENSLQILKFYI